MEWCATDLDYVGAPWLPCADSPWVSRARVGNGGLSLRKVDSFLKVLASDAYWVEPEAYWNSVVSEYPPVTRMLRFPNKLFKRIRRFNGVQRELRDWHLRPDGTRNEDHFWSDRAVHYYAGFKVASFEVGLRFAFEVAPGRCFELNGRRLPFGCHAWPRYDRAFWEPYLLQNPSSLADTKERTA